MEVIEEGKLGGLMVGVGWALKIPASAFLTEPSGMLGPASAPDTLRFLLGGVGGGLRP